MAFSELTQEARSVAGRAIGEQHLNDLQQIAERLSDVDWSETATIGIHAAHLTLAVQNGWLPRPAHDLLALIRTTITETNFEDSRSVGQDLRPRVGEIVAASSRLLDQALFLGNFTEDDQPSGLLDAILELHFTALAAASHFAQVFTGEAEPDEVLSLLYEEEELFHRIDAYHTIDQPSVETFLTVAFGEDPGIPLRSQEDVLRAYGSASSPQESRRRLEELARIQLKLVDVKFEGEEDVLHDMSIKTVFLLAERLATERDALLAHRAAQLASAEVAAAYSVSPDETRRVLVEFNRDRSARVNDSGDRIHRSLGHYAETGDAANLTEAYAKLCEGVLVPFASRFRTISDVRNGESRQPIARIAMVDAVKAFSDSPALERLVEEFLDIDLRNATSHESVVSLGRTIRIELRDHSWREISLNEALIAYDGLRSVLTGVDCAFECWNIALNTAADRDGTEVVTRGALEFRIERTALLLMISGFQEVAVTGDAIRITFDRTHRAEQVEWLSRAALAHAPAEIESVRVIVGDADVATFTRADLPSEPPPVAPD